METAEIQKFDANEAMKSIKERIKEAFVTLIPDEQWDAMVKKEIEDYFREYDDQHKTKRYASSFTRDVHELLTSEVRERVKTYLTTNLGSVWYDNGIAICNEKVEEMILKNSGKLLADMIGAMISQAIMAAGYRM